jgi:hypothetical protein
LFGNNIWFTERERERERGRNHVGYKKSHEKNGKTEKKKAEEEKKEGKIQVEG